LNSLEVFDRTYASDMDSVPRAVWFFRSGVTRLLKFRKNESEIARRYQGEVLHLPAFSVSCDVMTLNCQSIASCGI